MVFDLVVSKSICYYYFNVSIQGSSHIVILSSHVFKTLASFLFPFVECFLRAKGNYGLEMIYFGLEGLSQSRSSNVAITVAQRGNE